MYSTCDVCLCVGDPERQREDISPYELYSKIYHVTSLNDNLCATLTKSNDCYRVTTTPGGLQLLSHVAPKWNNKLKQIGGNFDSKHSSALRAKINGGGGHLHMAFFRQAMFDLWKVLGCLNVRKKDTPLLGSQRSTSDFHVHRKKTAKTKACPTGKWAFELISKSWSDFSCYYQLLWSINKRVKIALEQLLCFPGKRIIIF